MRIRPLALESKNQKYGLLLLSLLSGFFLRDFIPSDGLTLQPTMAIHPPQGPVLELPTSATNFRHSHQEYHQKTEQSNGDTFVQSDQSITTASSSASPFVNPLPRNPPVFIPIPPPPPPPPSSSPRQDSLQWTPEGALLTLTGEGRCAQSEATDQWLPNLLRNVDQMITDDKLFSKILTENTVSKRFGTCGSGVIKISQDKHPSLYGDFRDCMKTVRAIPDSRYCEPVIFHSFWGNLPVRKQAVWFILSFLLTQDPEFTVLWIWSPPGIAVKSDPLMAPIIAFAGNRVVFKSWNASYEAKNTQLELRPDVLTISHDQKFWLDTDLLRSLALRVYGGVYVDMDVLLLRNLGPLLGDEWLYQWGTHCVLSNGALMRFKKNSAVSNRLLDAIISTKPIPDSTCWGKDAYIKAQPFSRLPVCFLNAGWMTNNGEDKAFFNNVPHISRWSGAFAFHLHGAVFSQGDQAASNSEYSQAKKELWSLLRSNSPALAEALSSMRNFLEKI
jgi:hypothetical protein